MLYKSKLATLISIIMQYSESIQNNEYTILLKNNLCTKLHGYLCSPIVSIIMNQ